MGMTTIRHGLLSFAVVLAAGCGPGVGEMRMQNYPSRGTDCDLEFVKLKFPRFRGHPRRRENAPGVIHGQEAAATEAASVYAGV
jgi:hypothetical protein